MKTSKFSETQIVSMLDQQNNGTEVSEICRKHGISAATFYKWRQKYAGADTSMLKRFKALEQENSRLKRLYAEERLKIDLIQEQLAKKW